ncbi:hypothetical protein [Streptomyces sp. NPDC006610]|jgi:anti-sigma-K factor RskA|uniref:hypothetical protein n=1 Tax=Streptomyces sp. NPDC006610 TaxID=3154584 RepID=UPI0033A3E182
MSASTHPRPHPANTGRVDIRLPWWALALPALAFGVLLAMMMNPAEAHAAGEEPVVAHLVERVQQLIAH